LRWPAVEPGRGRAIPQTAVLMRPENLTSNSLLAGLGCEPKRLGSHHRCRRTHQQSGHVGSRYSPRSACSRSTLACSGGSRTGGGRQRHLPARELERAMVVQRAPCIRVVEGEASVAPLDHARSPLPICPHRIAMYQVRTDHQPRAVACLRVCSHLGRTFL
jgi:hypothetical protein